MKQNVLVLCFLMFGINCFSQDFTKPQLGVVRVVHDGDSYGIRFLERPDTTIYIRIHNIDAPEVIFYVTKDQPYSRKSAENMRAWLKGDTVEVTLSYMDTFRRLVCDVSKNGIDVAEYAIQTGNAWYQPDIATTLEREAKLKQLQEEAKKKKKGLWGEKGRKYRPDTWRKKYSRR